MARKNISIIDDLAQLPWWLNVILAVIIYPSFKYWIPSISFENPFYKGIAMVLPSFAPFAVLLLCLTAAVSVFQVWRKGALLEKQQGIETLRAVSWQEFEELVGEAYRRKGYHVIECGGGGVDGGIDLALNKNGEKHLVQCKQWRLSKVGVKTVRELFGVVTAEGASGGILISSGIFTQEAKDFAVGKPLELIGGKELLKMIAEVQKTPMSVSQIKEENVCTLCGNQMLLRTARKAAHQGKQFWGCSAYPKCRGTKQYTT